MIMMKCPYECGWKGEVYEYIDHYLICPKRLGDKQTPAIIDIFPFLSADDLSKLLKKPVKVVPDLRYHDDFTKILFNQLNERLQGPPTEFVIKRVTSTRYAFDGYSGFKGKIVLSINVKLISLTDFKNDDFAYLLIHEILHKKYPEASEKMIEDQLLPQAWDRIYPHHPNPNVEYKRIIES